MSRKSIVAQSLLRVLRKTARQLAILHYGPEAVDAFHQGLKMGREHREELDKTEVGR